jgi:hypothetical protein
MDYYDTATISNVLNVIKEPEIRQGVLQDAYNALKAGGQVYVSVYQGNETGIPAVSSKGWQENRKLASYLGEVKRIFTNAYIKNGIIIGEKNAPSPEDMVLGYDRSFEESNFNEM